MEDPRVHEYDITGFARQLDYFHRNPVNLDCISQVAFLTVDIWFPRPQIPQARHRLVNSSANVRGTTLSRQRAFARC